MAYVKPASSDGIWDRKILEFIHSKIVNKTVSIRVEENVDAEYVPCTLIVGAMDLVKVLVAEKLAMYTDTLKVVLKLPETYDFYHENSVDTVRDVDLYKESGLTLEEFKEQKAKQKEAALTKEFMSRFDINHSLDYIVEDSDCEVEHVNKSFHCESNISYDFNPQETSTTITTAMKSFSLSPFQPIKFNKDVTKFPCKIYEVLDAQHLYVEPIIEMYNSTYENMERMIKRPNYEKIKSQDLSNTRYCLAPYSEDKYYYRAVINDRISATQVRVRFVDYLNEEVVECKSLRECPDDVMKIPLKHLLVQLHGIKPSRRIRDADIKRQMDDLIGRKAVAFVVVNGEIPSVRLFDDANPEELVYKPLIDLKFYTESNN